VAVDPVSAIANAFTQALKFLRVFFKTPDEKKQSIDNRERERELESKKKGREYLKDRLDR